MKNFCVVDVETRGKDARPSAFVFGCVFYKLGNRTVKKYFDVLEELKNFLLTSKDFTHVFAHNAEFDYSVIFGNIYKNLDREAIFAGGLFISAKKDKKNFCNSLALFRTSVKSLGKGLGFEKIETPEKFFKKGDEAITVTKTDIDYCFRDCEIVYKMLTILFAKTGTITKTIASSALKIFTTYFWGEGKNRIERIKNNYRKSYVGGRVEVF